MLVNSQIISLSFLISEVLPKLGLLVYDILSDDLVLKYQEVAVKKFLDQDFSGAALSEFKREVSTIIVIIIIFA